LIFILIYFELRDTENQQLFNICILRKYIISPLLIVCGVVKIGHFRYIKIQLDSEAQRTQTKEINKRVQEPITPVTPDMSLNSLCLCPLSLTAKLNLNIYRAIHRK